MVHEEYFMHLFKIIFLTGEVVGIDFIFPIHKSAWHNHNLPG